MVGGEGRNPNDGNEATGANEVESEISLEGHREGKSKFWQRKVESKEDRRSSKTIRSKNSVIGSGSELRINRT